MEEAKSAALRVILGKRRTEKEVRDTLIKKGFSPEDAEEAASYYRETGFIDHADYARRYAHDAANIKGFGPQRIRHTLLSRGIEESYIEDALSEIAFDIETPMEARFGKGPRSQKELARIFQHFYRKGFASAAVQSAMDALYTYE